MAIISFLRGALTPHVGMPWHVSDCVPSVIVVLKELPQADHVFVAHGIDVVEDPFLVALVVTLSSSKPWSTR